MNVVYIAKHSDEVCNKIEINHKASDCNVFRKDYVALTCLAGLSRFKMSVV